MTSPHRFIPLLACLALVQPALHCAEATADATKKEEPLVLSIFQVTGEKDEGYRSTQTTSGSRTLSNLRDTPTSISVLNRELLDDLMATKLGEALFFSITGEISDNTERTSEDFIFSGRLDEYQTPQRYHMVGSNLGLVQHRARRDPARPASLSLRRGQGQRRIEPADEAGKFPRCPEFEADVWLE